MVEEYAARPYFPPSSIPPYAMVQQLRTSSTVALDSIDA